jgi:hypothetical protein
MTLSDQTLTMAGILFLSLVTIEFGGVFVLKVVRGREPATDLQHTFFRAGHAHAGMFVTLGLIAQVFVDATELEGLGEWVARSGIPLAALLVPAGFFLSVARRGATEPSRLFLLLPAGVVMLAVGSLTLGIGLLTA